MQDCKVGPTLVAEIGRLAKLTQTTGNAGKVLGDDGKEVATHYGRTYPAPES